MNLKSRILAGLAGFALLAAAVQPGIAQTVLRIKGQGDIQQMDPLSSTNYPQRDMAYLIFDTLFSLDAEFKIRPQMVDTYTVSNDKKTYRFTLRSGLKFHDGAPVTSADCIASIQRWMSKDSLGLEIARRLDRMDAINANTFAIVMKEPFARVLDGLSRMTAYPLFIMPERIAKTPIDKLIPEVIGSGPFRMVKEEWVPGVKFVLRKNTDYVPRNEPPSNLAGGKLAKVDRIERIHIPDDVSAVNALIAGEIDFMEELPNDMLPLIKAKNSLVTRPHPDLGRNIQIVINHTQPPMNNVKVRQALQHALNQADFLSALFGDRKDNNKVCPAIFLCGGPYETDINSQRYMRQDFEKAKQLLKEAGYDGTPIVYLHPTDNKLQLDGGAVLVASMRKAGFVVQDEQMTLAAMFSRRSSKAPPKEGGWNVFLTAFGGDAMLDPLINPFVTGACEKAFVGWPCDKELQARWQEFLLAEDAADRKKAAVRIQDRANEIVTFIPMGQYSNDAAWQKNVTGLIKSPVPLYWNISKN